MRVNKRRPAPRDELLLDDIYRSDDPAVRQYLNVAMYEEMEKAHERAVMRVALHFSHRLSPHMQQTLARQMRTVLSA